MTQAYATPRRGLTRRTQEQRRAETQGLLLQATIDCLVELGYARTTTQEVLSRAGVSKGALTHHYASKADLVLAAMATLYDDIGTRIRDDATRLPVGPERARPAVLLLWQTFDGPMFPAAMELWTAARTDDALREALEPHERNLAKQLRQGMREVLGGPTVENPDFDDAYRMLLTSMRGQALARFLRPPRVRPAAEEPMIELWVQMVGDLARLST